LHVQNAEHTTITGGAAVPLLDATADELRRIAEPDEIELALRFAGLLYADATPEFFTDRSPETLAALALSALRHLQRSRPDRIDIDVVSSDAEDPSWDAPVTVIRTNVAECPFIVGTIREYLHGRQLQVERFLHPVIEVRRDARGSVLSVGPASAGAPLESLVHCEIARVTDPLVIAEVREQLTHSLEDVVLATGDFDRMVDALRPHPRRTLLPRPVPRPRLPGGRRADPDPAPEAAHDHRAGRLGRGLARLQGSHHDLQLDAEGGAVPAHRRRRSASRSTPS
jgi:hypothetical protein